MMKRDGNKIGPGVERDLVCSVNLAYATCGIGTNTGERQQRYDSSRDQPVTGPCTRSV